MSTFEIKLMMISTIGAFVLIAIFAILYYQRLRFYWLGKDFKRLVKLSDFSSIKSLMKKMNADSPGIEESLNDVLLEDIDEFQDELLTIEREKDMEPRFWWSEHYEKRLAELKNEAKSLRSKITPTAQ